MARASHPLQGETVWIPALVTAVHGVPGQDDPAHLSVQAQLRDGQGVWTNLANLADPPAPDADPRVAELERKVGELALQLQEAQAVPAAKDAAPTSIRAVRPRKRGTAR